MMKKIIINEVANGYVVTITFEGNQSPYDRERVLVAADMDEVIEILKKDE